MPRPADPNARASLIAAARAEFARRGIRGARIEDITAACGLSKGAFYLHFSAKEELFGEVVSVFEAGMDALARERLEQMERFFAEHGHPDARDMAEQSARYQQQLQLETELDRRALELMWEHRDVLEALIRGSQGTGFESLIWTLVDREVERVAKDFQRLQSSDTYRSDVPPWLFGSVMVGTYLLLAQQMLRLSEKPDLAGWARTLQRLVREGLMMQEAAPTAARPVRAETTISALRRRPGRALNRKTSRNP